MLGNPQPEVEIFADAGQVRSREQAEALGEICHFVISGECRIGGIHSDLRNLSIGRNTYAVFEILLNGNSDAEEASNNRAGRKIGTICRRS